MTQPYSEDLRERALARAEAGETIRLTLPSSACLAWLKAPSDRKSAVYQQLSVRLQEKFKQLMHDTYFQQVDRYGTVAAGSPAFAVMVFASIPPSTKAWLDGNRLNSQTADPGGSIYWDYEDKDLRNAMAQLALVRGSLPKRMEIARGRLQAISRLSNLVGFYKASQGARIVDSAQNSPVFESLLFVEAEMVNKVVKAALDMAEFRDKQMSDPPKARRALASFGVDVTNAFLDKLKSIAVGDVMLALGPLMFIEAARVLDPSLQSATSAMLSIVDVKDTIPFPPLNFPNYDPIPMADIVHSETLVHRAAGV